MKKTKRKKAKKASKKSNAKTMANLIPGQDKIDWNAETQRLIEWIRDTDARIIYIDLFCGFGGTTAGVAKARHNGKEFSLVALGINHDDIALACHKAHNQRTLHLREDIRDVVLTPIKDMIAAIRAQFPHIKVYLWTSAECTHHSRAKGGDSRDADSRSLAEELYRYEEAIKPDMIQVENVTEFRSWGPLMQKNMDLDNIDLRQYRHKVKHHEYGPLRSKNNVVWISNSGLAFKKSRANGITPWMVPIPERKKEYFNEWRDKLIVLGYTYEDKDINSADHGAHTARTRYYGQFSSGMPIVWPVQTHCKDPDKHFIKTGVRLLKWKAVREILDFSDTGESVFVLGRISSAQTFKRLTEGAIKHIAGGKENYKKRRAAYEEWINDGTKEQPVHSDIQPEDFLIKYNSAKPSEGNYDHSIVSVNKPAPTLPCRNMVYKTHFDFMVKHFGGNPSDKSYSLDGPAHTITNKDHNAKVCAQMLPQTHHFIMKTFSGKPEHKSYSIDGPAHTIVTGFAQNKVTAQVLPFIVQFNKNCDLNNVDSPSKTLTQKDKFGTASFIQQRNSGNPANRIVSVDGPARTITSTGGNQDLVQVQEILPYISNYYGNGHNTHGVNSPSPTIVCADIHSLVTPEPFIYRQFSSGGTNRSINDPAGSLINVPKMNMVSPQWINDMSYKNKGTSVDDPCPTLLASRHHAYVVNPAYFGNSSSVDAPSPVVVARQDKAPLHLAQVQYGDQNYIGIIIYTTDCEEIRELKYFMAIYGIVDIKMRMLKEIELLPIQGFPPDYIEMVRALGIKITSTNAKKYIGNSQEVETACSIVEAYGPQVYDDHFKKAA